MQVNYPQGATAVARPHRVRCAFTLIELLVVVAIIGLLAAILFPVFGRARENARRSACQSNLKQIGLGIMQYTQDYDERLPISLSSPIITFIPAGTPITEKSPLLTINFATQSDPSWRINWIWAIHPYTKSWQIMRCPSSVPPPAGENFPIAGFPTAPNGDNASSYTANAAIIGRATRLAGISAAAETIMVQEGHIVSNRAAVQPTTFNGTHFYAWLNNNPLYNADCAGGKECGYNRMHFHGGNMVYADGHVKWRKQTTLGPADYGFQVLNGCGRVGFDASQFGNGSINGSCVLDPALVSVVSPPLPN